MPSSGVSKDSYNVFIYIKQINKSFKKKRVFLGWCKTPEAGPPLKSQNELASTPMIRENPTLDANCKRFYYQLAEDELLSQTPFTEQDRGVPPEW
jgi:hypothetical protein